MPRFRQLVTPLLLLSLSILAAAAGLPARGNKLSVPIAAITTVEGVRGNMLVGYGLVVGLNGTGDQRQTQFTIQTLSNILQRMGVQTSAQQQQMMMVHNVAAVFVTATLPAFAQPGMQIDVTVSSTGDAR
ncbi:MAG: flagellar basal body P-ring protein FlgI, partial [Terriglobales bacterium]